MDSLNLPSHLEDKIFEIRFESNEKLSKIVSYFPLSESEKQEILSILNDSSFNGFFSIFTDTITEEEWNKTNNLNQLKILLEVQCRIQNLFCY